MQGPGSGNMAERERARAGVTPKPANPGLFSKFHRPPILSPFDTGSIIFRGKKENHISFC